ncbi:MAG: Crp/Fnr family transcriptional regulator, partial [Fibromonadaceae bacterium]|nr:Crp/Fnr family transcriptional regulator [Fibromonadaceae bacterium]
MPVLKPKNIPNANAMELFRRVDFFGSLDEATLNRLASIATVQHFQDDETIMLAGDARRAIFFITKGQAKVLSDTKNARNTILNLLGVGDFFGEIQLFNESGKSATSVRSDGECSVIIFRGKDFINEMTGIPQLSIAFLRGTTQKVSRAYMQIASLSMSTIKGRIKSCIMQFIEEMGVRVPYKGESAIKLKNRPTQQQLAEMSGTTRETVNR